MVYHTPYSERNQATNFRFLDEFTYLMSEHQSKYKIITIGDFNLHVNDLQDANASIFLDIFKAMGLTQYISFPTYNSENTLDLIIMEILSPVKVVKSILGHFISDHALVECCLSLKKEDMFRKVISIRYLKSIDVDAFVANMDLDEITGGNLNDMVETIETKM